MSTHPPAGAVRPSTVTSGLVGVDSAAWPAALARVPHDVFHLPGYAQVDAEGRGETARAYVYRDGPQAVLVPLVLRAIPGSDRFDAISPYGYPGPTASSLDPALWKAALCGLQECLHAEGVVSALLRLHPLLPDVQELLAPVAEVVCHGATVSIDLRLDEPAIVAGIRENHHRDFRRARQRGYHVVIDDWGYAEAFLEIYAETMLRVGATDSYDLDDGYLTRLRQALGGSVHLATGIANDRPATAALFFEHDGMVSYHLGGTSTDALGDRPSKLLLDTSWRWAKALGCHSFLLGGGLHGSSQDSLYHYKAGFSARSHPFSTARLVTDPVAYAQLCAVAGRPDPVASPEDFFPAYRRPALA